MPPEIAEGLGEVAEERAMAKQAVLELQINWKPDSETYMEGKKLYNEAEAAVNGWINKFQMEVRLGTPSPIEKHIKSLEEAAEKSETFINYVGGLPKTPIPGEGEVVAQGAFVVFGGYLIDAFFKIWEGLKKEKRERLERARKDVIDGLEKERWPHFADRSRPSDPGSRNAGGRAFRGVP